MGKVSSSHSRARRGSEGAGRAGPSVWPWERWSSGGEELIRGLGRPLGRCGEQCAFCSLNTAASLGARDLAQGKNHRCGRARRGSRTTDLSYVRFARRWLAVGFAKARQRANSGHMLTPRPAPRAGLSAAVLRVPNFLRISGSRHLPQKFPPCYGTQPRRRWSPAKRQGLLCAGTGRSSWTGAGEGAASCSVTRHAATVTTRGGRDVPDTWGGELFQVRAALTGKGHLRNPPEGGERFRVGVGGTEGLHVALDGHGCGNPPAPTWLDLCPPPRRLGGPSDAPPERGVSPRTQGRRPRTPLRDTPPSDVKDSLCVSSTTCHVRPDKPRLH